MLYHYYGFKGAEAKFVISLNLLNKNFFELLCNFVKK